MEHDAQQVLELLGRRQIVVVDVETSGLDWKHNYIVGYVFTFGMNQTYYIPVRHRSSNYANFKPPPEATANRVPPNPFEINLNKALKDRAKNSRLDPIHMVGHHISFDMKFMFRHKVFIECCTFEDTMNNACLLNEYRNSYSLMNCCLDDGVRPKEGRELYSYMQCKFGGPDGPKQMSNFWKLDGDDKLGVEYAKGDGESTWELMEKQHEKLEIQDLLDIWRIENRVTRTLWRMMTRGVRVDIPRLDEVEQIITDRLAEAHSALPNDLNLRSGPQMKALFDAAGITNYPQTDKGNPSFAEKWLQTTGLGRRVIAARKYANLKNSFIEPLRDKMWSGRIHTTFNQSRSEDFGTRTGRLSSNNPNMQQVPKRNVELGKLFRSVFVPDDGMKWGSADYSQCEPRLLTHYTSCKVLLDGYRADPVVDAHQAVATAANIDRTSGKRLNQGLITGMGMALLISELGVGHDEGKRIYENYFEAMPEIKSFQKHAASVLKTRGYVRSLLGRRARMDPRTSKDTSYKAVNRLLQCSNADIIKKAMVDMDDYFEECGDKVHLLLSIHDSMDMQFFEYDRAIYEQGLEIMQDFGPGRSVEALVPFPVDAGEGTNWAEASYEGA
jgi:DNA polymerase-1